MKRGWDSFELSSERCVHAWQRWGPGGRTPTKISGMKLETFTALILSQTACPAVALKSLGDKALASELNLKTTTKKGVGGAFMSIIWGTKPPDCRCFFHYKKTRLKILK